MFASVSERETVHCHWMGCDGVAFLDLIILHLDLVILNELYRI